MSDQGLTAEELLAESATALPDKEVVSILDLNVDVDVFIEPPIATDGLGYDDRTTLRDRVRGVIAARLAAVEKPAD